MVFMKKGENGRRLRAQCPVSTAGKCAASMAAENCTSCRKSIRTPRHIKIWSRRIFCAAIFCRYWTCTFSCRNNQAIGLRLSAFSPFYIVLLNVAKLVIFCELYKYLLRKKPTKTDKTRQIPTKPDSAKNKVRIFAS